VRTTARVKVGARTLALSNLDKVLYPEAGFTKAQVMEYYHRVGPHILPHLRGRPLTMRRFPDGVAGESFYEKRCPDFRPDWVAVSPIQGEDEEPVEYCLVNSIAALLWVANLASLELHTLLSRHPRPDRPTMIAFDLDPGEPATLLDSARAALLLREALDHLGLQSYVKTSGGKGLHAYLPLNTPATFDQTKHFARGLAQTLERRHPSQLTSNIRKAERRGKVLLDWSQNDRHKTTVCVYSLRAHPRPTVSTPVTWDEIERAVKGNDAAALVFEPAEVLRRVEEKGDLFKATLAQRQRLPGA
jgi:bifunctional non-homologous end joining protein LigD